MAVAFTMPHLGESITEGTVGTWFKEVGEYVEKSEPLLEVISDKVDTEVVAQHSGVLLSIEVEEGDTVPIGTVLCYIGERNESVGGGSDSGFALEEKAASEAVEEAAPFTVSEAFEKRQEDHVAQPASNPAATKRQAAQLSSLITARPVPSMPTPFQASTPPASGSFLTRSEPIAAKTSRRQYVAKPIGASKHAASHMTTLFEANLSAITRHSHLYQADYQARGVSLTFMAYLMEAVIHALHQYPEVNSTINNNEIQLEKEVNIGLMTATNEDVLVPVIKRANKKNLLGLAYEIDELFNRVRSNALTEEQMKGGTFSICDHGRSGSLWSTSIIQQAQSATLGVGKIEKRVIVTNEDAIIIRPMVYLSLTFDSRVLDSLTANAFMSEIIGFLESYQS